MRFTTPLQTEARPLAHEPGPTKLVFRPAKYGHDPLESQHPYLQRIAAVCGADTDAQAKLSRAAHRKPDAAIVRAYEACTGPGVRDPLAVALAELARRTVTITREQTL